MVADHRRLGRELGLFTTDELLGAGLPVWLPRGAAVRASLERYVVQLEQRAGYQHVYTPALARRELYEQSGHWQHYAQDMFPPMRMGEGEVVLRPMNCPHHVVVYRAAGRSYRELPLRVAELGAMYRAERSGVVGGLSRVRAMTLNDGHVFCAPEQVGEEIAAVVGMIGEAYRALGIRPARYRLSLRGGEATYAAGEDRWARAEGLLRDALDALGLDYEEGPGEAAFYAPKLDVQVRDPQGREETLSTLQVDLVLPERFGLSYTGPDGRPAVPVMLHRSIVSTMERMVAHLLEVHDGALPAWLAPVQVLVLPAADAGAGAVAARDAFTGAGLRAELDDSVRTLAARIRAAHNRRIPFLAVVGPREAAGGTVSLRRRGSRASEALPLAAAVERVRAGG